MRLQTRLTSDGDGRTHEYHGRLDLDEPSGALDRYYVEIGNRTESFRDITNGVPSSDQKLGSTLSVSEDKSSAIYTLADGTHYNFILRLDDFRRDLWILSAIEKPNGEAIELTYDVVETDAGYAYSLRSVRNNFGYQIKWLRAGGGSGARILAINNAFEACEPLADTCAFAQPWPYLEFGGSCHDLSVPNSDPCDETVSESGAAPWIYHWQGQTRQRKIVSTTSPTGEVTAYVYAHFVQVGDDAQFDRVASVSRGGRQWTYNYYSSPTVSLSEVSARTDPLGSVRRWTWRGSARRVTDFTDELDRTTLYDHDGDYRVIEITYPLGNSVELTRDERNNITMMVRSGGGVTEVTQAAFDATCANPVTCNKPLSITDPNGAVTFYTYDPVHGGVLTETGPAVDGITPVKRYTYIQRAAWYLNDAGVLGQHGGPIWLLAEERTCRTTKTVANGCAGGSADEIVTAYEYGPEGVPNNLNLRGIATTAGGQTLRTCYAYDRGGNRISETSPQAGLGACS